MGRAVYPDWFVESIVTWARSFILIGQWNRSLRGPVTGTVTWHWTFRGPVTGTATWHWTLRGPVAGSVTWQGQ